MKNIFELDHNPKIGVPEQLVEGLRVITAPNASPMTFTGTRTYLLGEAEIAIIDPGPDDDQHLAAILKAVKGQPVSHIFVTHSHIDHSPLSRRLSETLNAPVLAFGDSFAGRSAIMSSLAEQGGLGGGEGIDAGFTPDMLLSDGETTTTKEWSLQAVHTPGHLSNHICFAWGDSLFSGDHVMGWSTTLVSPPDGDLTQFMESMQKLLKRDETLYYPGHGGPLRDAHQMIKHQINHRNMRESQILQALRDSKCAIAEMTQRIYADINPRLIPVAERNVLAHIIDLHGRGLVSCDGSLNVAGQFQSV